MPQTYEDIADLMALTLRDLGPMHFEQIAQDLTRYEVMGRWLKKDNLQYDTTGIGVQRNLMTSTDGSASHTSFTEPITAGIGTHMAQLQVPWRFVRSTWGFYRQETLMNKGKQMIVNVVLPRRTAAMIDLAKEMEIYAWQAPSSSSDTLLPYGIPYYVVYNATTGFTGGAPSGHTTVANVNLTTNSTYKNYSVNYTNVDKPDLIKKMRTAKRKIQWESPTTSHDYSENPGKNLVVYTSESIVSDLEDIGEGQNENLGRDLASHGARHDVRFSPSTNEILFRGHPIVYVPYHDNSNAGIATNALYMIDHSTFYVVVLEGDDLVESKPIMVADNPDAFRIVTSLSYNYVCHNRRRNAILATAA